MSDIKDWIINVIFGFGVSFALVGVIILFVLTGSTETELGNCYDRYGNVIQDVTCEVPVDTTGKSVVAWCVVAGIVVMIIGLVAKVTNLIWVEEDE